MTVLPKRKVGKTKIEVTTLGLGGAPMGGFRANIPDSEAHALTEGQHAFVHLAAAHAFEQKGRIPDAIAELQVFLAEDKTSPQSEEVRKALVTLQAALK